MDFKRKHGESELKEAQASLIASEFVNAMGEIEQAAS